MRRFLTIGPSLVVLLAVVVTLLAAPAAIRRMQVAQISATVTQAQHRLEGGSLLEQLDHEIQAVADAALPGTVHIEVRNESRWFNTLSNGAGWFYDDRGHIVTNAHVVGTSPTVRVELFDGRVRDADVIGVDAMTDVALLKIDPGPGVFPLRRASSTPLPIGSQVFAFGSPFGIKFSMSRGVVSGLGRSESANLMGMSRGYTNFIQTDAAMNPGNSGGPLVDINARVVGMNAAIANGLQPQRDADETDGTAPPRPLGQSAGIGFAIPIETVEAVVQQLMETDVVLRGYLGVQMELFSPAEILASDDNSPSRIRELRDNLNGFSGVGVVVSEVPEGQPADKAGMQPYDVIVRLAGRSTPSTDVLRSIVSVHPPGKNVPVTVWRDGREVELTVRLGAAYNLRDRLRYIPGSEDMTMDEIRRAVRE